MPRAESDLFPDMPPLVRAAILMARLLAQQPGHDRTKSAVITTLLPKLEESGVAHGLNPEQQVLFEKLEDALRLDVRRGVALSDARRHALNEMVKLANALELTFNQRGQYAEIETVTYTSQTGLDGGDAAVATFSQITVGPNGTSISHTRATTGSVPTVVSEPVRLADVAKPEPVEAALAPASAPATAGRVNDDVSRRPSIRIPSRVGPGDSKVAGLLRYVAAELQREDAKSERLEKIFNAMARPGDITAPTADSRVRKVWAEMRKQVVTACEIVEGRSSANRDTCAAKLNTYSKAAEIMTGAVNVPGMGVGLLEKSLEL